MSSSDKVSLKWFLETVEEKLDSFTPEQLRSILMEMALQVSSSERREFLDKLTPLEDEVIEEKKAAYQEDLLNDIGEFIEEIERVIEEDSEVYYDERSWYDDDEDALGPYEDYVGEMEELFDRANAVFDNGDLKLAGDAYNRLFDVFEMEDDFGGGIGASDLAGLDIREVIARYLRSVYETTSPESRPQMLFHEMSRFSYMTRNRRIGLEDLIQITTDPLPDKERFLNDWISFLSTGDDKAADYWMREATRLAKGTAGLEELALSEGEKRPKAFLDWIATLMNEGKYPDAIAAAEQARQVIKPDMPIRAAIADHLREAAGQLNDAELASSATWEAFYARPKLSRFLDVWESISDEPQRMELMERASERVREYLFQKRPDDYSLDADDVERYVYITKSVLAHAYLLSQQWESAHKMSLKENELGWSGSDNPQGLTVICFLGLAAERTPSDFPPNLSLLWNTALEDDFRFSEDKTVLSRLKQAYKEMFSSASLEPQSLLDWCLRVSKKRAASIVQNQYRKSYWKAATLITACAEVLSILGQVQESQSIIAEIRNQFPRHRAFQAELRQAEARR